jgi:FtsH-binding integral membrane protein
MLSSHENDLPEDGTTQLLRSGSLILIVGLVAITLLMTVFGGVGVEGAHSNSGWLALIIGAMCLPFGLMLAGLGAAKWLRRRNLSRKP